MQLLLHLFLLQAMDPFSEQQAQFLASVPEGAKAGESVIITAPNGVQCSVEVPPNLSPGEQFAVGIPAAYGHPGQIVTPIARTVVVEVSETTSLRQQFPIARDVDIGQVRALILSSPRSDLFPHPLSLHVLAVQHT